MNPQDTVKQYGATFTPQAAAQAPDVSSLASRYGATFTPAAQTPIAQNQSGNSSITSKVAGAILDPIGSIAKLGVDVFKASPLGSYANNVATKASDAIKNTFDQSKIIADNAHSEFVAPDTTDNIKKDVALTGRELLSATGKAAAGVGGVIASLVPDFITNAVNKGSAYLQSIGDQIHEAHPELAQKFDEFANNPTVNNVLDTFAQKAKENPDLVPAFSDAFNTIMLGYGLEGTPKAGELNDITTAVGNKVTDVGTSVINKTASVGDAILPNSESIMNRVARLKPTDANKFVDLAGETHGDYLAKTGNFGTPDKIVSNEAAKFTQSINNVDAELAKLPGVYKDGSVTDALSGLVDKAKSESGANIKSPYLAEAEGLLKKSEDGGLTMSEINQVKRLYERNVKLGYNKLINADKVTQATNIDNALRNFQVDKAKELGFNNISELNKQTQISKYIIDKLGDQIVGKEGLNGFDLSDWVMLAGGDPTAVGGFLTKKFFSSNFIQSKIAKYLSGGDVQPPVSPDVTFSPENIKRQVSPEGLIGLPEGKSNPNFKQDNTTIIPHILTDEPAAQSGTNTTVNKTGDAYVRDRNTNKVKIVPRKK